MKPIMQKLGMSAVMLSIFLSASAYDFEVDSIYYNITDSVAKEVEVTYNSPGSFFSPGSYSGAIVVPSSVSYEGENYKVTALGTEAFAFCDSLTSIEIPNSVTAFRDWTLAYCRGLTTITIPNSVTTIGSGALEYCTGLTSIKIPSSVSTMGKFTFNMCDNLTNIEVDDENEAYMSKDGILYNKSQTTIVCCPRGKTGEIIIPNSVTAIGDYAFDACTGLKSIIIPNTVTTIGESAFFMCFGLKSITIPNSVTTIGSNTFLQCIFLKSITSLAVTPPGCGMRVFDRISHEMGTLYVPAGSMEAYKQAPEWKGFMLVAEAKTGIDPIEAGDAAGVTEVYNLAGVKVAATPENLPAGIYIVREGLTARKIVVR